MKCPVCRAAYRPSPACLCKRCGADLTPLVEIHDRAIHHYRQAITSFNIGAYDTAQAYLDQAIAIDHRNADFYALSGQLWALQGNFQQAIDAWKQAKQLDPKHPTAASCLQIMLELVD